MRLDLNRYTVLIADKAAEAVARELSLGDDLEVFIRLSLRVSLERDSFAITKLGFELHKETDSSTSYNGAVRANKKKAPPAKSVEGTSTGIKILYDN